jgi:polysaccharide export outer membrane protein
MVGGDILDQARSAITTAYQRYVTNPQVSIQIVQARSFRYYVMGEFSNPGVKYPGHAMMLLPALALGGSVALNSADLYQAYVAQGGVKLPVDLHSLLVEGDMSQNIWLASGDTIVVPSSAAESAFVLGAVGKPGQVPFVGGSLSLLQALGDAGLGLDNITEARMSAVRIIRPGGASAQLIVVNARATFQGEAGDFALRPGDIVYVPPTEFATWNQAIKQVLPSLEAVSALLNPFVSIAYLSRNN